MAQSNLPYFLLGLGVGAAWGLIFAPKSGEALRGELASRGELSRDYVRRHGGALRTHAGAWRNQAGELIDRSRTAATSQREHLAAALEAGRRAYREAVGMDPGEETRSATSSST